MCGIIGYVGKKKAVPILLEGLKRVEYRGYDSAGIAVFGPEGEIKICKKEGKIVELERAMKRNRFLDNESTIGIGHTRWATHGEPTDINAHPHLSCRKHVAVVHNGIIENFSDLRNMLIEREHIFQSETDTEIFAHLIGEYLDGDPLEAVRSALSEIKGTYGLAVIFRDYPDLIVFARKASPLCLGLARDGYFVASDPVSFRKHTNKKITLEDGEIGYIKRDEYGIMNMKKVKIARKAEKIEWELEQIEKSGYDHFMFKEICEQPQSLQNTVGGRIKSDNKIKLGGLEDHDELLERIENVILVAAGTSYYAGMIGEILIQEISKIPAQARNASELANQKYPCFSKNTAIWAISQSGETADLLLAIRQTKKVGLPVFGLCNVVGSSVARETVAGVYIHAGPEIGVASTKAFTSQVLALHLISLYLRQLKGIKKQLWMNKYLVDLKNIRKKVGEILEAKNAIKKLAKKYCRYEHFLFLGRGINYPTAMEGALKLKEISYIHAEGYPAGEMKHGPIALVGKNFPSLFIVPKNDENYDKIISNIKEIKARKGSKVIAVANEGDKKIADLVDDVIYIPSTTYYLTPILFVIAFQLFAYYCAVELGRDVDQPRNLAKSVTVE